MPSTAAFCTMDNVSRQTRSKIMASVRSKGNRTTEIALGKQLRSAGIRGYRKHWPVIGKPDFAWPGRKIAIFVDGCFWHGCGKCRPPRMHTDYWRDKIERNRKRDRWVTRVLRSQGWTVVRIRECAVVRKGTIQKILRILNA